MRQTFHPAMFLGTVVLLCIAWLWARPPQPVVERFASSGPRPALVQRASIALDAAILERYAGRYEGRGDVVVDLFLKEGKLLAQSPAFVQDELLATSETEFFFKRMMGVDLEFDVSRDGTVRGFAATTDYGLIKMKRVR